MENSIRRHLVVLLMSFALAAGGAGCKRKLTSRPSSHTETTEQPSTEQPSETKGDFVVSFLYGGPKDDGGFNQAHAAGAAAVRKLLGVKVVEEENVPESGQATLLLEKQVLLQNAKVVFATAYGHFDPPVLTEAEKHPEVHFLSCNGRYQEGKHPANAGSYGGYLDEAYYVSGIVAGMTTKSKRLGFIAGKPLPHVLRDINAFTLGARSVNPKITTSVVFTGAWSNPAVEEKAVNDMADKKIDVVAMYVNAPRTILQAAERHHLYSVGVHVNGAEWAPKGYLTGAEWNWQKIYTDYVLAIRDGKPYPHIVRGGIADGYVNISPFGPAVSDAAKQRALDARTRLAQGKLVIFKGPLGDNHGRPIFPKGQELIQKDVRLELMGYLVEGVLGNRPD
jgi:basic membrane protein A